MFLNALDLDIESEQIANEAVVQYQLERGKFDKARSSAENARGQSLRYEEKINRIIEQTKRDIRQVRWRDEVHGILVDGVQHVQQRLKIEDGIIRSATDKLNAISEGDDKCEVIRDIIRLMKECRHRHLNLNKVLMSARGEFLEQQSRQCFVDVSLFDVVNLRDDVLGQLLLFGREQLLPLCEQIAPQLVGPTAPQLLSLADLLTWQLQPRRAHVSGESALDESRPERDRCRPPPLRRRCSPEYRQGLCHPGSADPAIGPIGPTGGRWLPGCRAGRGHSPSLRILRPGRGIDSVRRHLGRSERLGDVTLPGG